MTYIIHRNNGKYELKKGHHIVQVVESPSWIIAYLQDNLKKNDLIKIPENNFSLMSGLESLVKERGAYLMLKKQ